MTAPMLRIDGLRAGYGRAEVLHGLTLQAAPGSVITVIGPNGAGKSTLLNTLMGVIPSHGTLEFDGKDIADLPLEDRVMMGMALVPERRELFGSMTVEDNLVLGAYRQVRLRNRDWRAAWTMCTRSSRGCRSAGCSWPARCPAASARCWRWRAR